MIASVTPNTALRTSSVNTGTAPPSANPKKPASISGKKTNPETSQGSKANCSPRSATPPRRRRAKKKAYTNAHSMCVAICAGSASARPVMAMRHGARWASARKNAGVGSLPSNSSRPRSGVAPPMSPTSSSSHVTASAVIALDASPAISAASSERRNGIAWR
jgi:hypothetical protein